MTFRKMPYERFDISNTSRFKHAVFEDSQFLENVKMQALCGGEHLLRFYQTALLMKSDAAQKNMQPHVWQN